MTSRAQVAVADLLASILGVEHVSPEDDFFHLGGDSLAATVLMAALEQIHQVVIDPVEIFERPQIGEFSAWLDEMLRQLPEHSEPSAVQM